MAQKQSRWWASRRGAIRIFWILLRAVGTLLFTAVGVLLCAISFLYVATLSGKTLLSLGAATAVAAVLVLIRVGQHYEWTGFGESVQPKPADQEIQPRKTLWDWLQLLIVPLMLAAVGLWFTAQQDARQQQTENQRAQDEALQAYLDQMGSLLLEKHLRNSAEDSEVRTLARARTLTVLRRVDTSRKNEIVQFLVDAGLVHSVGANAPVIELVGVNLSGNAINLHDANLRGAILKLATLRGSDLSKANLSGANLSRADLRFTSLYKADLSEANLKLASLKDANLSGADLSNAKLSFADLSYPNLSGANLSNAKLTDANLKEANLKEANLKDANLKDANLKEANLSEVYGLSDVQIAAANTLEGATMPNGQKYEDWLKSKNREEDG